MDIKRFTIIDSLSKLKKLSRKMKGLEEFAFDTETNTLRVCGPNKDFILVGISISWGEYNNYYIPTGHKFDTSRQVTPKQIKKALKEIFEDEEKTIIGHNIKFDMHVLARIGMIIKTPYIFDTMVASWICDENEPKGLKENMLRIFNVAPEKFKDVLTTVSKETKKLAGLKANNKATYDLTMIKDSSPYAIADSFNTWRLYLYYLDKLQEEEMDTIYYKTYPPFIRALFNMEEKGITVDTNKLKAMEIEMNKDLEDMKYKLLELAGVPLNVDSNQDLAQLLFGYDGYKNVNRDILSVSFKFPVKNTTPKGAPQVNGDTFEDITKVTYKTKRKQEGIEFCKVLLDYKKINKLKTAFVEGLFKQLYGDGKAHPSFNPVGTDSGRISCSSPNLMQLPNAEEDDKYKIREVFIGSIDEETNIRKDIISVDYSNLEVRVMAHYSKDPSLLQAFKDGVDLHGNTAKMMFRLDCHPNEVKKLYPNMRQQGKVIAFLN